MHRAILGRRATPVAAALAAVLLAAGCGSAETSSEDKPAADDSATESPDAADVDTSAAEGPWLLGISSAGGADAETSTTVYVTFDPSTGEATAHKLPGVTAGSSSPEDAALLVSSDRAWAIPDTEISGSSRGSGQVKVYSLTGAATKTIDLRNASGTRDLKPVGWAFDPATPATLRVVDTRDRVWTLDVASGKATAAGALAKGPWVFLNGFNKNTGEPYMESIDSDRTNPAGNGPADTSPVTRDGGTVLASDSEAFSKLPANPCRVGAGFVDGNGVTWAFCADKPSITTYYLPKDGQEWTAFGKASSAVAPEAAAFPLALPPAS